ncbi:MAG: hypothetical protein ACW991_06980, partial [Candidatus Hodarchaeales archaeon]
KVKSEISQLITLVGKNECFAYTFAPKILAKKTLGQILRNPCLNSKYFSSTKDLSPLSQTICDRISLKKSEIPSK